MFDDKNIFNEVDEAPTSGTPTSGTPTSDDQIQEQENITSNEEELGQSDTLRQDGLNRADNIRMSKSEAADRNFKVMEMKLRSTERERDEALRYAQTYNQQPPIQPEDELLEIGDEDISEGRHVKSYYRAMEKKLARLEEKIAKNEQTSTAMSTEAMLKAQYPDIEKVVTKENIDALRAVDPEFAEMLDTSSSFRAKVISAYKHIKKMGLYTEDTYMADRERVKSNAVKPKSLASVSPQQGDSPLSRANAFAHGLTEELKKQLNQEMEDAIKNR